MNTSITQATQNDKQISKSIKRFFTRFHISSALKASNAYKRKGIPVTEIFQYLFLLIFSNRSMYMSLLTGRNTPDFAKDTVYRFMKMVQINWMRFTTILASRIIKDAILPLDSEDRANVLIIDDSMFERNRSKKVELLAKVYDHAKHKYRFGFRMLTLGWSDGSTFLPVNSILLSTEKRRIASMKRLKWTKEPLVTSAGSCPWKREPMPCLRFWMQLKKLQFRRNTSFLTAGLPLQAPFMLLNRWILM